MPEVPELENLRRQLEREVVGKRVKSVSVAEMHAVRRHPNKSHFAGKLDGVKLAKLERRGTRFVFTLDNEHVLVVDLGSAGQLRKAGARDAEPEGTCVEIAFTQGGMVRFVDTKGDGELFVVATADLLEEVPDLAEIGLDPIESPITWTDFAQLVLGQSIKLKHLLTDQSMLAGIGPVYSDEILYDAGLRYDRVSDTLSIQEVRRLARSVVEILHDAIKHGGTSLDGGYLDLHGEPGGYNDHLQVYERTGEPCIRCRDTIKKAKFGGRNTFFCEQCQT